MNRAPVMLRRAFWIMTSMLLLVSGCATFKSSATESRLATSQIKLKTPSSAKAKTYLGLPDKSSFALSDIDAKLIVLGYYGIKCPFCHEQAPVANSIYAMIRDDAELSKDVKMIGVMIGSNPKETEAYAERFRIPYPMTNDPFFEIYSGLGKTNVPLTLVMTPDGRILARKTGVIADPAGFVKQIGKLRSEQ